MGKIYDDGNFFSGVSYSVDEISFTYTSWNDSVGSALTKVAKTVPSSFNYAQVSCGKRLRPFLKWRKTKSNTVATRAKLEG
ncbi:MAG: hypothetical protein IKM16_00290 [Clostridia bacterium]|nr:hypothetical protein [Clostridia bacterium]